MMNINVLSGEWGKVGCRFEIPWTDSNVGGRGPIRPVDPKTRKCKPGLQVFEIIDVEDGNFNIKPVHEL